MAILTVASAFPLPLANDQNSALSNFLPLSHIPNYGIAASVQQWHNEKFIANFPFKYYYENQ
jgi:hypothetical protein